MLTTNFHSNDLAIFEPVGLRQSQGDYLISVVIPCSGMMFRYKLTCKRTAKLYTAEMLCSLSCCWACDQFVAAVHAVIQCSNDNASMAHDSTA